MHLTGEAFVRAAKAAAASDEWDHVSPIRCICNTAIAAAELPESVRTFLQWAWGNYESSNGSFFYVGGHVVDGIIESHLAHVKEMTTDGSKLKISPEIKLGIFPPSYFGGGKNPRRFHFTSSAHTKKNENK